VQCQRVERESIRTADVDLNLVLGWPVGRRSKDDEFRSQQIRFECSCDRPQMTIVISLVSCRATEAVGSSDAKIPVTRSCTTHGRHRIATLRIRVRAHRRALTVLVDVGLRTVAA